jgi:hypothetical protein
LYSSHRQGERGTNDSPVSSMGERRSRPSIGTYEYQSLNIYICKLFFCECKICSCV